LRKWFGSPVTHRHAVRAGRTTHPAIPAFLLVAIRAIRGQPILTAWRDLPANHANQREWRLNKNSWHLSLR